MMAVFSNGCGSGMRAPCPDVGYPRRGVWSRRDNQYTVFAVGRQAGRRLLLALPPGDDEDDQAHGSDPQPYAGNKIFARGQKRTR